MRRIPTSRQRSRGMSLIELMIVIVLIGSILALITNRVLNSRDQANARLTQTQLITLAGKIDQFRMDTGKLPESLDELVTSPGVPGWLGPYAQAAELKDPWGANIDLRRPGENGPFELVSLGADGAPGGESFNADIRKP